MCIVVEYGMLDLNPFASVKKVINAFARTSNVTTYSRARGYVQGEVTWWISTQTRKSSLSMAPEEEEIIFG